MGRGYGFAIRLAAGPMACAIRPGNLYWGASESAFSPCGRDRTKGDSEVQKVRGFDLTQCRYAAHGYAKFFWGSAPNPAKGLSPLEPALNLTFL